MYPMRGHGFTGFSFIWPLCAQSRKRELPGALWPVSVGQALCPRTSCWAWGCSGLCGQVHCHLGCSPAPACKRVRSSGFSSTRLRISGIDSSGAPALVASVPGAPGRVAPPAYFSELGFWVCLGQESSGVCSADPRIRIPSSCEPAVLAKGPPAPAVPALALLPLLCLPRALLAPPPLPSPPPVESPAEPGSLSCNRK